MFLLNKNVSTKKTHFIRGENYMKNERKATLIKALEGLGTKPNVPYTNQEIVNHLTELQSALAKGIFEKTHADNIRDKDIMIHFEALAKEYSLDETPTYLRFKSNMDELGYTIGSFIKGMSGERIAKRALKLLSYDKCVRILYNIQLEDSDIQAEYDAIVIAPYGLFIIEVKNWQGTIEISHSGIISQGGNRKFKYDLPGRMSIKEALLHEYLQEDFPENYNNMLLVPTTDNTDVVDNYKQISICCGGGITYEIRKHSNTDKLLTEEQINNIVEKIISNHKTQYTFCHVKCEEIINDYVELLTQIESLSKEAVNDNNNIDILDTDSNKIAQQIPWSKYIKWGSLFAGGALYCYKLYSDNLKRK